MSAISIDMSYVVLDDDLWDNRFLVACNEFGWKQTALTNNLVTSFFHVHTEYYKSAAALDAEARGFDSADGDYYDLMKNWGEPLPEWKNKRPAFDDSPLLRVQDIGNARKNQRRIKQLLLAGCDAGMLRLACEIDNLTLIQATSRIAIWHFDQYWDKKYRRKLESDLQRSFDPKLTV